MSELCLNCWLSYVVNLTTSVIENAKLVLIINTEEIILMIFKSVVIPFAFVDSGHKVHFNRLIMLNIW